MFTWRTTAAAGLAPPADEPFKDEYTLLKSASADQVIVREKAYLVSLGVKNPSSELESPKKGVFILGEPQDHPSKLIRSRVLNSDIEGWGPVPSTVPSNGDGHLTDDSKLRGFYGGDPKNQWFLEDAETSEMFYNGIMGMVTDEGIVFNSHLKHWGQSVFHEIFHTFEGKNLSGNPFFREGFVETFTLDYCKKNGPKVSVFAPYKRFVDEVSKLVDLYGAEVCARAYFGDDDDALENWLIYSFYGPINDFLGKHSGPHRKISAVAVTEARKMDRVRRLLEPNTMRKPDSWYGRWVIHNGIVPQGGPELLVPRPAGGARPPVGHGPGMGGPPLPGGRGAPPPPPPPRGTGGPPIPPPPPPK